MLHTTVDTYIVDSCYTFDEGYETAIMNNGNAWVIVERYPTYEEMKIGHEKWCNFCETEPTEVYSVQTDEMEEL